MTTSGPVTGAYRPALQYGGAVFEEASRFVRSAAGAPAHQLVRPSSLRGAAALGRLVLGLPWVELSVSDSVAGQRIAHHLDYRTRRGFPMRRVAQGVLTLPSDRDDYLRGRRRQAVRTNLGHARRAGARVEEVIDPGARHTALMAWHQLVGARGSPGRPHPVTFFDATAAGRIWLLARGGDGLAAGLAVATVDTSWAMVELLGTHDHPLRWLLHTTLVLRLHDSGVRYVFAAPGNALDLPAGTQHMQRLMGYRLMNISLPAKTMRPGEAAD